MVAPGSAGTGNARIGSKVVNQADASSSLVPWLSGALVAVGVVVGAFVTTLPNTKPAVLSAVAPVALAPSGPSLAPATAVPTPLVAKQAIVPPPEASQESLPKAAASPPARRRLEAAAGELSDQITLVDAARSALASGDAQHAIAIVREYQAEYPTGTFRPEVSAVKIEALVKMGRMTEARTLAERFVVTYGQGPLAARVARLTHVAEP